MSDLMAKVGPGKGSPRGIRTVVVGVLTGLAVFFLVEPIGYLTSPNRALFTESGWKSFSSDRSARISFLLWYGADPNAYVQRGYTSLHSAIHWESLESTVQLLDAGADVNMPTESIGEAVLPLDIACTFSNDNFKVIRLVSTHGGKRIRSHPTNWQGKPNPPECFDQ